MPGTKASALPELKQDVVMKRTQTLMALHNKIALENNIAWIGKETKVLVDEFSFGTLYIARNSSYKHIIVQSKERILGKNLNVRIVRADSHHLFGDIVKSSK